MATINSYCEKRKIKGVIAKEQSIFFRVKHDHKEFKFYIPEVKIELLKWDSKKQQVKGTNKEALQVNDLISAYKTKLNEAIAKTNKEDEIIDISVIRESFLGSLKKKTRSKKENTEKEIIVEVRKKTIIDLFDIFHIDKKNQYTPNSLKSYNTTKNNLLQFSQKNDYNLALSNINKDFYLSFLNFLIEDKKYINGTISINIKNIKGILRYCEEEKEIEGIPNHYRKFKLLTPDQGRYSNTLKEIIDLYNMTLEDGLIKNETDKELTKHVSAEVLEKVRDVYVFNFFSGLAVAECIALKNENIKKKEIETVFVKIINQKQQEVCYKKEHFEVLKKTSIEQYAIIFGNTPSDDEKEVMNNKAIPYTEYAQTETINFLEYTRGKTRKQIISPLNSISVAILAKYKDKYLKPLPVMTEQKMNQYLHCLLKQSEIYHENVQIIKHSANKRIETIMPRYEALTFHSARHGFATHLIDAGLAVTKVQVMMGHANIKTTMVYVKTDINEAIIGAIELFKPKY